jgi:hypothetical protein
MHDNAAIVVKRIDDLPTEYLQPAHPKGYEWSRPLNALTRRLALTLCVDVLGDYDGERLFKLFEQTVIDTMPYSGWRITAGSIERWATDVDATGEPQFFPVSGMQTLKAPDWRAFMPVDPPPVEWLREPPQSEWGEDAGEGPDGEAIF